MRDLLVIQAVVPDYRVGLFSLIAAQSGLELVCGDFYFSTVATDMNIYNILQVTRSKNIYFFKRRCLFQIWRGFMRSLSANNVRVVELNPRCVTSWLSLLSSRLLRRGKTVVWGHLLNRAGEQKHFSTRQLMMLLADGALFYTKAQLTAFNATKIGAHKISGCAPNSVVFTNQVTHFERSGTDFLYVGRLVKEKKPSVLLDAFLLACELGLNVSKLHIVGAGPEIGDLQERLVNSQYGHRVQLYGHNGDYEFLRKLYENSVCAVSPGYVGLSITQTLSFGRPMLISEHEPHAPEIEAFEYGINGVYFKTDDINDLAQHLICFYEQRESWASKSKSISEAVLVNYTYEAMAKGFLSLIDKVRKID